MNHIPCYTDGPSIEITAFMQRAFGEDIDPSTYQHLVDQHRDQVDSA
ncbi:hypothetical protein [Nocardia alba]|nr:hypothetical protein [Nocardia alba]